MRSALHWLLSLVFLVGVCSSFYRKEPKDGASGASKSTGNGRQGVSTPEQAKAIVATVKECVESKMLNRKFKKVAPQKALYTLMSSHTLEKINALPPHQLKQIEFLTGCVQEHVPYLFWDRYASLSPPRGRRPALTIVSTANRPRRCTTTSVEATSPFSRVFCRRCCLS